MKLGGYQRRPFNNTPEMACDNDVVGESLIVPAAPQCSDGAMPYADGIFEGSRSSWGLQSIHAQHVKFVT
jgi:hypothetical protein